MIAAPPLIKGRHLQVTASRARMASAERVRPSDGPCWGQQMGTGCIAWHRGRTTRMRATTRVLLTLPVFYSTRQTASFE